ncbi:hypothetical protein BC830DRAFT_1109271 [Chytriomyces sp. MP71]|nr:hypothetical protein BC830DRAFT_1109271 [Chytriomyces sp. MP71]
MVGLWLQNKVGPSLIVAIFLLAISSRWGKHLWQDQVENQYTPQQIRGLGLYLVGLITGIVTYLFFFVLDTTGSPSFVTRNKVQPSVLVKLQMYAKALPRVTFNMVIVNGVLALLSSLNPRNPLKVTTHEFPTAGTFVRDILACLVIRDVTFFASHYAFHDARIYKYFHKIHHEYTAPIAMASSYAHWLEHVIANVIPIAIGPIVMHSHILVACCFVILSAVETACVHSGYIVPLFENSLFHDYHHMRFNHCYGTSLGFMDWVFGTSPSIAELQRQYVERHEKRKEN